MLFVVASLPSVCYRGGRHFLLHSNGLWGSTILYPTLSDFRKPDVETVEEYVKWQTGVFVRPITLLVGTFLYGECISRHFGSAIKKLN